jgi:hypothetical protein
MDRSQQLPNIEFISTDPFKKKIPALYYETSVYHNNYETPGWRNKSNIWAGMNFDKFR